MPNDLTATGRRHAWSWPLEDWDRMWRPSMWLRRPPDPHRAHIFHLLAIVALASYANVITNQVLDDAWHIPFNLAVLGVALLIARRAGTTWTTMGLRQDRAARGVKVGLGVVAIIAVGVTVAIAIPATRELFEDDRVIENSVLWVLFQAVVRIPLATAFYEEVLFRGIVFGMLMRRNSPIVAAIWTSVLFGFWHVLPTLETLETNPAGDIFTGAIGLVVAIAGAVAGTMLAGIGFLFVRLYANSTWASVLAHIGTNSIALIGALIVVRLL
jgi:membrane protease YdiL (CAAX protease family)